MYDTVNLLLSKESAPGVDFLGKAPQFLTDVRKSVDEVGQLPWLSGHLGNLKVSITESHVRIYNNSICKYYFGNNFQTLNRQETQTIIEQISDALHLPFERASVTRIDFAANMFMDYPESVYYPYLGEAQHYHRFQQTNGLYYSIRNRQLVFYGKIHEQKDKRQEIPEEIQDKNMLRYEIRFLRRLRSQLQPGITAELLYNKDFYEYLLHRWKDEYLKIRKIRSKLINIEPTGSKRILAEELAMMALDESGQAQVLQLINEWLKMGLITRKQAYDNRTFIKRISIPKKPEQESELIHELNTKIEQIVKSQFDLSF